MNKNGQSTIEYALIAVLIVLGVVIMGPYVLRSVNGHFKLWDDGVQDSFRENINQAPLNDLPTMNVTCTWSDHSVGCGGPGVNSQCGSTQMTWAHTTNPQGCDGEPASYCLPDTTGQCCITPTPIGCGTIPLNQPATSTNCNLGQEIIGHQCGSNTSIECIPGTGAPYNCPTASCVGTVTEDMFACPGQQTGMDQDFPIVYALKCDGVTKCQYIHNPCLNPLPFRFPRQGQNYGGANANPNGVCAAYGFPNGGYAYPSNRTFTTPPAVGSVSTEGYNEGHNNPYLNLTAPTQIGTTYSYTSDQIASSISTANFSHFSFNGYSAGWDSQGNNSWTDYYCYQDMPATPNQSSPDTAVILNNPSHATMCAGNPVSYTYVNFTSSSDATSCDTTTKCQAFCNPGYYAFASTGPCIANTCAGTIPTHSTLCLNNPLPATNNASYTTTSTCDGTACQALCNTGYLPTSTGTCVANTKTFSWPPSYASCSTESGIAPNQISANQECVELGYNHATTYSTVGYSSCGNDTIEVWSGTSWSCVNACSYGNRINSLTCTSAPS